MDVFAIEYWTGETVTVTALNVSDAAIKVGYTDEYLIDHSEILDNGEMVIYSDWNDFCARISVSTF